MILLPSSLHDEVSRVLKISHTWKASSSPFSSLAITLPSLLLGFSLMVLVSLSETAESKNSVITQKNLSNQQLKNMNFIHGAENYPDLTRPLNQSCPHCSQNPPGPLDGQRANFIFFWGGDNMAIKKDAVTKLFPVSHEDI